MGRCYDFYVKFDGVEIKGYILLLDDLLQTSSATTHSTVLGRKYTGEREGTRSDVRTSWWGVLHSGNRTEKISAINKSSGPDIGPVRLRIKILSILYFWKLVFSKWENRFVDFFISSLLSVNHLIQKQYIVSTPLTCRT